MNTNHLFAACLFALVGCATASEDASRGTTDALSATANEETSTEAPAELGCECACSGFTTAPPVTTPTEGALTTRLWHFSEPVCAKPPVDGTCDKSYEFGGDHTTESCGALRGTACKGYVQGGPGELPPGTTVTGTLQSCHLVAQASN